MKKNKEKFKHPKGLWLVNTMMAIQSYASYATSGFVILFYTYSVAQGGLGLNKSDAGDLYAYLGTIGSLLPLAGAWITDRYLGMQRAIKWGILFNSIGMLFIAYSHGNFFVFMIGISINLIAGSFFRGNLTALVGELYTKDQATMKDAAYSLFYMFVNIGSLLGPIVGGLIYQDWGATKNADGSIATYGFSTAYLMVSICLFITFLMFQFLAPTFLGDTAKYPVGKNKNESAAENKEDLKLTKYDKGRFVAMAIIFIFSTVFWSAYFQTQSTITLMTDELVNLNIFGFNMPLTW
ncbi:MFS transporter [Gemella cuniculi]|uniref:MFS transporter n=1 Tax=Gemella cuniculi TaxID=150240 RepID=UPI0004094377|nr:MFS transporter [Gemella cuniculi]